MPQQLSWQKQLKPAVLHLMPCTLMSMAKAAILKCLLRPTDKSTNRVFAVAERSEGLLSVVALLTFAQSVRLSKRIVI
jgi:hypothetical protein